MCKGKDNEMRIAIQCMSVETNIYMERSKSYGMRTNFAESPVFTSNFHLFECLGQHIKLNIVMFLQCFPSSNSVRKLREVNKSFSLEWKSLISLKRDLHMQNHIYNFERRIYIFILLLYENGNVV